jgi:hypothetical protein
VNWNDIFDLVTKIGPWLGTAVAGVAGAFFGYKKFQAMRADSKEASKSSTDIAEKTIEQAAKTLAQTTSDELIQRLLAANDAATKRIDAQDKKIADQDLNIDTLVAQRTIDRTRFDALEDMLSTMKSKLRAWEIEFVADYKMWLAGDRTETPPSTPDYLKHQSQAVNN